MKYAGSCGLKHARYDTSCMEHAWRCRLVHNSSSYTGTPGEPSRKLPLCVLGPAPRRALRSRTAAVRRETCSMRRSLPRMTWRGSYVDLSKSTIGLWLFAIVVLCRCAEAHPTF